MEASLATRTVAYNAAERPLSVTERLARWRPPWYDLAACRGVDVDVFFPARGEDPRPARAICARCEVRRPCESYAIAAGDMLLGVWAGLSARERRQIRKERRERAERFAEARERGRVVASTPGTYSAATEMANA